VAQLSVENIIKICCSQTTRTIWAHTFAKTSRRVAACAARSLLEMERALAATPASDMSLVVPLTEAGSTLAYHL
jgi:hypothetical protein